MNIFDAVPLKQQGEVRVALRGLAYAPTRAEAERLRAVFAKRYRARFPKAVERLAHDGDRLVANYDFPAEHWRHLRTTTWSSPCLTRCACGPRRPSDSRR